MMLIPDTAERGRRVFEDAGVRVFTMPLHRLRESLNPLEHLAFASQLASEVCAIRRLLKEQGIDVVQSNGLINVHGPIAGRLERRAVVWQIIDTRTPMIARRALLGLARVTTDVLMSTGRAVASAHPGTAHFSGRLVPFFPPVDTHRFAPNLEARREARHELGVPEGAVLIGTVANLLPQKGHDLVLRAAARHVQDGKDIYVRILGATVPSWSNYADALVAQAEELGLVRHDRFRVLDPGTRVSALLPAFDVFALAAVPRSEGIPTAILEAMACGIPVVATAVGSIAEVVEHGRTGLVIEPGDVAALADALLTLSRDADQRRSMGHAARERAVTSFNVEACADAHLRAYELALAHRQQRGS